MAKKLIITFNDETNNLIRGSKTDTDSIQIPIENYPNEELFIQENIWAGLEIYSKLQRKLSKLTKDYDEIIFAIQNFHETLQGFIYCFVKSLKRRKKKVTLIFNSNILSRIFINQISKYCEIKDVYSDKEYQDFYKNHFPKVSILELDGLLNTIYLRELGKCA